MVDMADLKSVYLTAPDRDNLMSLRAEYEESPPKTILRGTPREMAGTGLMIAEVCRLWLLQSN